MFRFHFFLNYSFDETIKMIRNFFKQKSQNYRKWLRTPICIVSWYIYVEPGEQIWSWKNFFECIKKNFLQFLFQTQNSTLTCFSFARCVLWPRIMVTVFSFWEKVDFSSPCLLRLSLLVSLGKVRIFRVIRCMRRLTIINNIRNRGNFEENYEKF